MKRKMNNRMKLNLQFFAEPARPQADNNDAESENRQNDDTVANDDSSDLSIEERMQQLLVENAKLKKEKDKASSEAADYKKKYNATLTDVQRAAQEKADKEAEREEQFNRLLKENQVNKLEKSFLALGYPEDKANQAAIAQYDGDTDTLFKIQSEMQTAFIKHAEAEWLKSRPEVNSGADNGSEEDSFLKGFYSVGRYKK